jgi:hypothetical protein
MKWPPITSFFESLMSVTFNGYPNSRYHRFHNDQNQLVWVVPRQLTQSVPTLKVTVINHSKKEVFGGNLI